MSGIRFFFGVFSVIVMGFFLSGCPIRGTDEAFRLAPKFGFVTYSILRAEVLEPFGCIRCHDKMGSEPGLQEYLVPGESRRSRLFEEVERKRMPKDGTPLSDDFVALVARYIDGLKPSVNPTPTPTPLAPSYKSLYANLFKVSCRNCHGVESVIDPNRPMLPLNSFEAIKNSANKVLDRLEPFDPEDLMPPDRSSNPKVTTEVLETFKEWVRLGFPDP